MKKSTLTLISLCMVVLLVTLACGTIQNLAGGGSNNNNAEENVSEEDMPNEPEQEEPEPTDVVVEEPTDIPPPTTPPEPTQLPEPEPQPTDESLYVVMPIDDGGSVFVDNLLGYQMAIPKELLVVIFDEDMETQLMEAIGGAVPEELKAFMDSVKGQIGVRMMAIDYLYNYAPNKDFNTNINYLHQDDPQLNSMTLDTIIDTNVQLLPQFFAGSTILDNGVFTNSHGVEYGMIVIEHPAETFGLPVKQYMAMIKVPNGIIGITGSSTVEMYPTLEPVFKQIIDSLEKTN